jgi:phosphoserine phosphatase RsbU/P
MNSIEDVVVLFVDDEPELISSLRRLLRREKYGRLYAANGEEALKVLESARVDIIVSDLRMPYMDGLALLSTIKKKHPDIIRVILSANQDISLALDAINRGEVYRFFSKPVDPDNFKRFLLEIVDFAMLINVKNSIYKDIGRLLLTVLPPKKCLYADVASQMHSAERLAGDFVDFFDYQANRLGIVVGDVMGKGVRSALIAASIKNYFAKSLLYCGVHHNDNWAVRVVSKVHEYAIDGLSSLEYLVTLCFADFNFEVMEACIVNCGHLPVIHYRPTSGECKIIHSRNFAMGMVEEVSYESEVISMAVGDIFLFYSDGITEAKSPDNKLYGYEQLTSRLVEASGDESLEIIEYIKKDALRFSHKECFEDDMTCVVLKVL